VLQRSRNVNLGEAVAQGEAARIAKSKVVCAIPMALIGDDDLFRRLRGSGARRPVDGNRLTAAKTLGLGRCRRHSTGAELYPGCASVLIDNFSRRGLAPAHPPTTAALRGAS